MTDSGATIDQRYIACRAFAPITWSARDTARTVEQVKEHNAAWQALCRAAAIAAHTIKYV